MHSRNNYLLNNKSYNQFQIILCVYLKKVNKAATSQIIKRPGNKLFHKCVYLHSNVLENMRR